MAGEDKESGPSNALARDMAWLRLLNKNRLLKGSGETWDQWLDTALIQVNSDGWKAWLIQLKTNSLNFTPMAKEPNLFCRGSLLCYFVQKYCVGGEYDASRQRIPIFIIPFHSHPNLEVLLPFDYQRNWGSRRWLAHPTQITQLMNWYSLFYSVGVEECSA